MTVALVIGIAGLAAFGAVLAARYLDVLAWQRSLVAFRLYPPADLGVHDVTRWLTGIAASTHPRNFSLLPLPPVVVEIVASPQGIAHYLLVSKQAEAKLLAGLRADLPGARLETVSDYLPTRAQLRLAAEAVITNYTRPLATERAEAAATALLAALQPVSRGSEIRYQLILTSAGTPSRIPTSGSSRNNIPAWWEGTLPEDAEAVQAARAKQREALLRGVLRVGVAAPTQAQAQSLLGRVWPVLHTSNAPSVRIRRRWLLSSVVAGRLTQRAYPITKWPLLLNTAEAAALVGLPVGKTRLLGLPLVASRQIPPPYGLARGGVTLAVSNYPGALQRLQLARDDRLRHLYVVGPVGVGKSTLLANLAVQDMHNGDGLALIDPKGDLASDVLARIPQSRRNDVIVVDLADTARPIGLNALHGGQDEHGRELAADFVLSVLRSLWAQYWGPRTDDILRAALLTLTHTTAPDGSAFTLVEVPELLTNLPFRRFVTEQPTVPTSLRQFWAWFENVSDAERVQIIGPVLNKLRQFTTRTSLRLSLGQSRGLDIPSLIRHRRIVLVTLSRGIIGTEAAYLLGSLLVAGFYQATLGRAAIAPAHRRPFWLYLDEFHQVARLPIQLADLLAEARGLGVGVIMANQYVSQLSPETRAAVLGTVRSQAVFQVEHDDARLLEPRFAPSLSASDLTGLAAFEVALRLCSGNQVLAPTTGITLPLSEPVSDVSEVRELSRQRYGQDRADVEAALVSRVTTTSQEMRAGRRQRGGRP